MCVSIYIYIYIYISRYTHTRVQRESERELRMYMTEEERLKGLSPTSIVAVGSWGIVTFFFSLILYFLNFIIINTYFCEKKIFRCYMSLFIKKTKFKKGFC